MLGNYNENNAKKIIDFCTKAGFPRFAIAGILANWYHESVLDPGNAQNSCMNALRMTDKEYTEKVDSGLWIHPIKTASFGFDGIGYGLAQWTSSGRKEALYLFAKETERSIADLDMQLEFFYKEITSKSYKTLLDKLMQGTDEKQAAIDFMVYYERPASVNDQDARNSRANTATEFYKRYFTSNTTDSAYLMSANTFISKLWDIATNYDTLYVLGTWGWPATPANKTRAINKQSYNATTARKVKIEAASRNTFFFDCGGLIKGPLWGWCGDPNKAYGGAGYACNGVPDSGNLIGLCKEVSTDFSNILPAEIVSIPGHVGVYVGNGMILECTPKWKDCVQQTWLGNTGHTKGNYRMWDKHGKLPWIDYSSVVAENEKVMPGNITSTEDIFTGDVITYEVLRGDNLTKIAKKFSTTVEQIVHLNNLTNPNLIRVGQKLVVKGTANPSTIIATSKDTVYVVRKGDTLTKIARDFKTTVVALALKNGITNPNRISVGQVLTI